MSTAQTFLAFDFGLKRIGIAVGNNLTYTVQGIQAVSANNGKPDWPQIEAYIKEWSPHALVVGIPLSESGEETEFCKRIRKFGNRLHQHSKLQVYYANERNTSIEANRLLRQTQQAGKQFSARKIAARDSLAAELILNTFFGDN